MTIGKNKGLKKSGKTIKKADKHPFAKKEWYQVISAPSFGTPKPVGWVPCNIPVGKKRAEERIIGRVCEVNYADIKEDSPMTWRKVKMQVEKVEGQNLYTSFAGMTCTRERIVSQLRKRQTLIDVFADVKTSDNNILRIHVLLCTNRHSNQRKINSYAKSSQVKRIRKQVIKILTKSAAEDTVDNFSNNMLGEHFTNHIITEASKTFPIRFCIITKVKVMKKAKVDVGKLVEDSQVKAGQTAVIGTESPEAMNPLTKEILEEKKKQTAA
jgi:small subunit ribosomal protein S3Ae